ncbi:Rieske (2Fe-2S) protein [Sphingobacterium sp. SRCM116780]|uniref:Rieske (2Fe-2S) protein n=1 Tax=Sphingobacterium sp. SRCM116780 TaxID=2907623 RepID=UPI001F288E70|nr:Rieske (2Fe-2S) protein [Sphingobacterium sp. SRCM116780]UIR57621.1 Rieske (2Fe-2S) protein [Sphingobacterium sp. SRCM116780]
MLQWYKIDRTSSFDSNRIYEVNAGRTRVCIVNDKNGWKAFSRKCPHAGASFLTGWCEDNEVVCSYHRHRFDLTTGKGCPGQGDFIKIYPTKVEQDELYIAIETATSFFERLFK